jgi:uncharacterized protein (DUF433 family)
MRALESKQSVPLLVLDDGTMRVAGTRVSLDSLVYHYQNGASAEELALKFPGLRLADIHACLAYYLDNQEVVQEYLVQQEQNAREVERSFEIDPEYQRLFQEMRERIGRRAEETNRNG